MKIKNLLMFSLMLVGTQQALANQEAVVNCQAKYKEAIQSIESRSFIDPLSAQFLKGIKKGQALVEQSIAKSGDILTEATTYINKNGHDQWSEDKVARRVLASIRLGFVCADTNPETLRGIYERAFLIDQED